MEIISISRYGKVFRDKRIVRISRRSYLTIALSLIFREVLKRENIVLDNETTAQDVEGWDSLTNMQLINKIEKKFNVRFTFRDIVKLKNVGDICHAILTKTN